MLRGGREALPKDCFKLQLHSAHLSIQDPDLFSSQIALLSELKAVCCFRSTRGHAVQSLSVIPTLLTIVCVCLLLSTSSLSKARNLTDGRTVNSSPTGTSLQLYKNNILSFYLKTCPKEIVIQYWTVN